MVSSIYLFAGFLKFSTQDELVQDEIHLQGGFRGPCRMSGEEQESSAGP
jgi:hypothetical protein